MVAKKVGLVNHSQRERLASWVVLACLAVLVFLTLAGFPLSAGADPDPTMFVGCDAPSAGMSYEQTLTETGRAAEWLIDRCDDYFVSGGIDSFPEVFKRWFDPNMDPGRVATAQQNIEAVQTALHGEYAFTCLGGSTAICATPGVLAADDSRSAPHVFEICPLFYTLPILNDKQTQAGVVIHEAGHEIDITAWTDPANGLGCSWDTCKDIATTNPDKALTTAYNYEYFCNDVVLTLKIPIPDEFTMPQQGSPMMMDLKQNTGCSVGGAPNSSAAAQSVAVVLALVAFAVRRRLLLRAGAPVAVALALALSSGCGAVTAMTGSLAPHAGQRDVRADDLHCSISAPHAAKQGDPLYVTFTLENRTDAAIRFLIWSTPFEGGELSSDAFSVMREGDTAPLKFRGRWLRRTEPDAKGYITIWPEQVLSSRKIISLNYDLTPAGVYTIRYREGLGDIVWAGTDYRPRSQFRGAQLDCNTVVVTVEPVGGMRPQADGAGHEGQPPAAALSQEPR